MSAEYGGPQGHQMESAQTPQFPSLWVTFRYAITDTMVEVVSTVYPNCDVLALCDDLMQMRKEDMLIRLGDVSSPGGIQVFPVRSILDIKMRLATRGELFT